MRILVKVVRHERLNNSTNSNPRFKLYYTQGNADYPQYANTAGDASINYEIENNRPPYFAILSFTRNGTIDYVEVQK